MADSLRDYLIFKRTQRAPGRGNPRTTPKQIQGWHEFERKLAKLGDFPKDMYRELRDENHRIGRVGARVLKNALPKGGGQDFVVYKRRRPGKDNGPGEIDRIVPKGTLRRSIRTWNSKGSKINVQLGPRGGARFSDRYNAYFAGIVDDGHVGGMHKSYGSRFHNRLAPALRKLEPRMRRIQLVGYRRIYKKWVKKM